VVKALKNNKSWICEICKENFYSKYKVGFIEAHHKTPVSIYSSRQKVILSDFALLCPNCHRAVHIHMKKYGLEYPEIKKSLTK
ncbi:MAG: HNH endonuclease, partial [Desulfobacteraceae bacterium]